MVIGFALRFNPLLVVVVAGLVAFVTLWWKMRQARRYGRPAFVVMRR